MSTSERPLIDERALADWCADLEREDILAILESLPGQCRACIADIEGAVAERELKKAQRVAHRLKGMAANLGAARLAQLARCIERECPELEDVEGKLPVLTSTVADTLVALAAHR